MATFNVSVDVSALNLMPGIREGMFQQLSAAVERVAMTGAERWRESVLKARLWDGERKAYADTIRYELTGPFSATIMSDYKYVEDIETGRPPYDLKRMLDTSTKVRRTKDGRRFLVIPFRDNTPGNDAHAPAMPQGVYDHASNLSASKISSTGTRPAGEVTHLSPKGGMRPSIAQTPFLSHPGTKSAFLVAKRNYDWGGKLTARTLKQVGLSAVDQKRYAGMHRFDATTPGGSKYSTYVRFRIMIEGSSGWIIPARPGLHIAEAVANGLRGDAEKVFGAAIDADLASA
ncbi:MAG: hypothetical protein JWL86_505 [Rhizobium sp.]|nr:hypothetical protein [Rhizobium sp.]